MGKTTTSNILLLTSYIKTTSYVRHQTSYIFPINVGIIACVPALGALIPHPMRNPLISI